MLRAELVNYNVSNLREPSLATPGTANRALGSAAGVATNFATRDALAEAPRPADRAVAVQSAFGTLGSAPSATDARIGRPRA